MFRKSDAPIEVMNFVAEIRSKFGVDALTRIHSDKGGEFVNMTLTTAIRDKLVKFTATQGYDPNSNGLAENYVGQVKRTARAQLAAARLSTSWWGVASLSAPGPAGCLWTPGAWLP